MAVQEIDLGNVKGPKGDQGPKGEKGDQGPQGPQGQKGEVDADTAIAFTTASTRTNIISGESIKTIFGKIAKWFADLKSGAFATVVNNLTTTTANTVLDGRQGKALNDKITTLNSALDNQFNRNLVQISSSTHYPQIIMYRSGQMVYLKCAGVTQKEIASDTELVTAAANYIPEEYRPISDIVAYPNISLDGKQIRLSIAEDGRITFTSPEKLPLGFAMNLHFVYATGKSNF